MTIPEIFMAIEPWLYLVSAIFFLIIIGASSNILKNNKMKAPFILLVMTQAIAYSIWAIQYVVELSPLVGFVGSLLDTCNPILIFVVMFESIKPKKKEHLFNGRIEED
jgi:hypothetical protein